MVRLAWWGKDHWCLAGEEWLYKRMSSQCQPVLRVTRPEAREETGAKSM